jgi:hypothetical protein
LYRAAWARLLPRLTRFKAVTPALHRKGAVLDKAGFEGMAMVAIDED